MNPLGSHQSKVLYILALMRILSYSFSSFAILLCRIPKVRASFSSFTVILQSREFVLYCFYDSSEAENHLLRKKKQKTTFLVFFQNQKFIPHIKCYFPSEELLPKWWNLDAGKPPYTATICTTTKISLWWSSQNSCPALWTVLNGCGGLLQRTWFIASINVLHHKGTGLLSSVDQMLISHILFLTWKKYSRRSPPL